jgi:hypothetical protein
MVYRSIVGLVYNRLARLHCQMLTAIKVNKMAYVWIVLNDISCQLDAPIN